MKPTKFIILLFLIYNSSFAQFPIGKNIKIGEKEIKTFLLQKGYHFLKESDLTIYSKEESESWKHYYYSEEFSISLWTNYYENVIMININTKKQKLYNELLNKFNYKDWTLIDTELETVYGISKKKEVYKYKNYRIESVTQDNLYQFSIEVKE